MKCVAKTVHGETELFSFNDDKELGKVLSHCMGHDILKNMSNFHFTLNDNTQLFDTIDDYCMSLYGYTFDYLFNISREKRYEIIDHKHLCEWKYPHCDNFLRLIQMSWKMHSKPNDDWNTKQISRLTTAINDGDASVLTEYITRYNTIIRNSGVQIHDLNSMFQKTSKTIDELYLEYNDFNEK